jgi:ABC-type amino acid transport system permease subunit
MDQRFSLLRRITGFYIEGFRNLPDWGEKVWIIIIIKVFILFFILKLFFFPDFLKSKYNSDKQRSEYVFNQLINSNAIHD